MSGKKIEQLTAASSVLGTYLTAISTGSGVALKATFTQIAAFINGLLLSTANAWTAGQAVATVDLVDAATVDTDASLSNTFKLLMTAAVGSTRELGNPTNMEDGQFLTWRVTQDGSGNRALTFGTKFKFSGNSTLSTAGDAVDIISGVYCQDTDTVYCLMNLAFA